MSLKVDLGVGAPPLQVSVASTDRQVGYDHDVTYAPAHVAPERAQLPSFDDWFPRLLAQLDTAFPARLTGHWSASFCQAPSFGAETAARGAFGARPPATARAELARLFGNDVDRVIARFAAAPRSGSGFFLRRLSPTAADLIAHEDDLGVLPLLPARLQRDAASRGEPRPRSTGRKIGSCYRDRTDRSLTPYRHRRRGNRCRQHRL